MSEAYYCIIWTHTVDFPSLALFSCSFPSLLFQPMQFGLQTFRPFGTENAGLNRMNYAYEQESETSWTFLTSLSSPTGVENAAN